MIEEFLDYGGFRFGVVRSESIKQEIFKLRYKVYAEEFGFEKTSDYPDGLEKDIYDDWATHMACLNKSGQVGGTIRLVYDSPVGFPIEHATGIPGIGKIPDRSKTAEISRLSVSKDLRRIKGDGKYGVYRYPNDQPVEMCGRKNPVVLLGLCVVMYQESKRQGITHWYIITEEKLFRTLTNYGFLFRCIGEPVFYHGERTPYLSNIAEFEYYLKKNNPSVFKIFLDGLESKYHPIL
jgi:N-acyl amino acid synthase of PEP-CTERM/exosortase system